jgi:hypothetical protein
VEPAVEIGDDV